MLDRPMLALAQIVQAMPCEKISPVIRSPPLSIAALCWPSLRWHRLKNARQFTGAIGRAHRRKIPCKRTVRLQERQASTGQSFTRPRAAA
jgi:hypothetical protein